MGTLKGGKTHASNMDAGRHGSGGTMVLQHRVAGPATTQVVRPYSASGGGPSNAPRLRRPSREDAQLLISLIKKVQSSASAPPSPEASSLADTSGSDRSSPVVHAVPHSSRTRAVHEASRHPVSRAASVMSSGAPARRTTKKTTAGNGRLHHTYASESVARQPDATRVFVAPTSVVKTTAAGIGPTPKHGEDRAMTKKQNKMRGNRLAAKRCRERKKQYISYLEERVVKLEASNNELASTLEQLRRKACLHIDQTAH